MAKRPLYAAAETVASLALLALFPLTAQAGTSGQNAACATCVAIEVEPEVAASLPSHLEGIEVFVRVTGGTGRSLPAALTEIERRGGRPALLVEGSLPPAAVQNEIGRVRRILLAPAVNPADLIDDRFAYQVKTALTALRAVTSGTTGIGLAADASVLSRLLARDLGSYVDFVVSDEAPLSSEGVELWRIAPASAASIEHILASTRTGAAARWIWRLPADPVVAEALAGDLVRVVSPPPATDPSSVGAGDRFAQDVQVVGSRSLTVDEIVARHQAAAARQSSSVQTLIATGTLTLSFEAPGFPAPVTISSEVTMFTAGAATEIEQREVRINGVEFRGSAVPRLPIIEPERVASPPLAIALTDVYRYRLEGRDTIDGLPCYVVSFEPRPARSDKASTLFRGRAWIAADSFAMVKVSAAQTGLAGAIVASEQTDEFRQAQDGVWLLARSDVRQMYEGAAHRTPIHRVLALRGGEVNAPDFQARRQFAYGSASVMLRDTPQGYRYLKKGDVAASESPALAGRADRVRTVAAGVILDPNISVPLPFAGFSYVDFNFLGSGTQINTFFGGTYGQFAFSIPSLGGTRWQLAGRGFAIASSYNDRSFVGGRERYEEDIQQRPAQVSVWLVRPLSSRVSLRFGYDLDYTHLAASDATAASFVVPADQVAHGARISLDVQRAGWNGSAWWNPARRSGWRAWGRPGSGDYQPSHDDFQRYGISISRSHVINPRAVARVEAAWMDGQGLDRFSRYSFGTFDNRLRGYPSALIRYDHGAVLRTAVGYGISRLMRVDGFLDSAAVHDPGFGAGLRNYTGVGAALEVPVPFGTLLAVEWGYGFRGVNSNGTLGTQVIRISGYKVF